MNTKTLDQLQAAAQAAAEALATAQREAQEAEAAAKQQAAVEAERAKREAARNAPEPASYGEIRAHLRGIMSAMYANANKDYATHMKVDVSEPSKRVEEDAEKGPRVYWQKPDILVSYRGANVYAAVEFRAEESGRSNYSYRTHLTGRLRMTVGGYGDRQSYPPRKDGTFNYDSAADRLLSRVASAHELWNKTQRVKGNAAALAELRAEFKLSEYSDVLRIKKVNRDVYSKKYTEYVSSAGRVFLDLSREVTPEQARAILAAAVAAGVKLN